MINPSAITQWLTQPATLSERDRSEVAALVKAYPYFIPLRYIEAAEHHCQQAFAPAMMNKMHLYKGNWLLFYEILQAAKDSGLASVFIPEEPVAIEEPTLEFPEREPPKESVEDDDSIDFAGFNDEQKISSFRDFNEETMIEEEMDYEDEEIVMPFPDILLKLPARDEIEAKPVAHEEKAEPKPEDPLIQPIYTEDYFLHQGIPVSDTIPEEIDHQGEVDKSLMVVMSFSEWLMHFKTRGERQKEEKEDQKTLKTMWQKEKLAAALEEENEEIPENVFEMAVNSITKEEDLASESLAEIMVKQGKPDKAIDMYRKLSLRNPQKNAYFARKIDQIQKEKES